MLMRWALGPQTAKVAPGVSVDLGQVSAQFFVDVVVVAFLVEVHVQLTENRTIGIRVTQLEGLSGPGGDLQQIVERFCHPGQRRFK